MIRSFGDQGTEDIWNGEDSKRARKTCPRSIWTVALRKLTLLDAAKDLRDLKAPPSNQLEALSRERKGQHSIRINDQYRVCFVWNDGDALDVEITDYH